MIVFDSKSAITNGLIRCTFAHKGLADEYRPNNFLANHGLHSQASFQSMRPSLSRQSPRAEIFVLRSIPVHGFRTTDVQITSRHRNLPACDEAKTVPCGLPRQHRQEYAGRCQRKTPVADICRLRTDTHCQGTNIISRRQLWHRSQKYHLRTRLNNHRLVSDVIPMGTVSQTQKRRQGAYADGLKRLYTLFYPHYRRFCSRCQLSRRTAYRAWRVLHHGSRLHRLCTTLHFYKEHGLLCDTRQDQSRLYTHQLSHGGQIHRSSQRSNHYAARTENFKRLSGTAAPHQLLRYRHQQTVGLFDQQLYARCDHNRQTLQVPMADRTFLQMAQTKSAHQSVFRHIRKRRQNANMDCRQRLCPDRHHQERTETSAQFGRNPANSQRFHFRASLATTNTYRNSYEK